MKNYSRSHGRRESGYVLIAILTTVSFVIIAAISVAALSSNNLRVANSDTYRLAAQLAADAGADASLQALNADLDWTDSAGEQVIDDNSTFRTTYQSLLQDGADDSHKNLLVTGRTYSPSASTTAISERSYIITLRAVSAGSFSLVSGVGGLTMRNSSKVIGGNVHINGRLDMSNSAQIGLSFSPVNVTVAHHNCPIGGGASYPSLCPPGTESPIAISNPAWIYGEVRATNSIDIPASTSNRMSNAGLVPGSVAANDLPEHDRNAQKALATTNMTGAAASCTANNGTVSWPANVKITGNVTVEKSCTVTATGDAWITGNLSMRQSGTIKLQEGISDPPVIMIDGSDGLSMTQSSSFASNSILKGFRVITYYSQAGCSPDCIDLTGQDLYDSTDDVTINIANTSSGPNTEFYARWSTVVLGNSGGIGALVGQKIVMENSAAVTFGVEVSGVNQINGWVVQSYQRDYNP